MFVSVYLGIYGCIFKTDMSRSVSFGPNVCEEFVCVSSLQHVYVCRVCMSVGRCVFACVCVCCLCGSVSPLDSLSYWVCKSVADMRGVTRSCGPCLRDDSETKALLMRTTWHVTMTTRGTEPHKRIEEAQRQ